jgi:hypothetical protein
MKNDKDDIEELEDEPQDQHEDTESLPDKDDESAKEEDEADKEVTEDEDAAKELAEQADDVKSRLPAEEEEDTLAPEEEATPKVSIKAPGQSPSDLSRFQQYMQEYKRLQDQQRKGDLVNGLIAAGGKIGQSIAGKYSGNVIPDQSGNQMLAKMNERPLQQFEQNQVIQGRGMQLQSEMAANDPNSPQSKLVRDYVEKRLGLKLDPQVSASDAQMLLKTVGRPIQTKFQKVNGTWTDPDTGEAKRMSAVFDPGTGTYKDADTGKSLPGFLAEGLNPFQTVINPNTGQREIFNKSRGGATSPMANGQSPVSQAQNAQDVNAALDPVTRKVLNDKVTPAFNKETEKIQQRLNHVPVILQRLEEAQQNPAALPQLKAEMARFDVGDQRLAQQELEMFAKRQGYKGLADWAQAKTEGTISPDFASDMRQAITHVSDNLHDQLNQAAEKHAKTLASRLPPGQQVNPKTIAPLIYGDYKPSSNQAFGNMVQVTSTKTGKTFMLPKDKVKDALAAKLIQPLAQ